MIDKIKIKRISFAIVLFSLCLLTANADNITSFRLNQVSPNNDLPSSSVPFILQDEKGFMWFASQTGLIKYDGYAYTSYTHDPHSTNSPSHNLIQTLFLDDDQSLWLGTYDGLDHFYPETGEFEHFNHEDPNNSSLSNNVIVNIFRDSTDTLWIGTLEGLNRYDEETKSFYKYLSSDEEGSLPNNVIRSIHEDQSGQLWIGTYGGLSLRNPENDTFTTFSHIEGDETSLGSNNVMVIKQDPLDPETLWLGLWDGGICKFNTTTKTARNINLTDNRLYSLLFDSKGNLWMGTWGGGLFIMDLSNEAIQQFTSENHANLSNNIIYSLYEDSTGIVWIGTHGGGIYTYNKWENQFATLSNQTPNLLWPKGKTNIIYESSDRTLWIGIYNEGLAHYFPDKNQAVYYKHDSENPESICNDIINTIMEDSHGDLWIGSNGGLSRWNSQLETFENFYYEDEFSYLPEDIVYDLFEDSKGNLWIGSYTSGLSVYNKEEKSIKYFKHEENNPYSLSNNLIRDIFEDSKGNIWIGTNSGLNLYNPDKENFTRFSHNPEDPDSLTSNNIRVVIEDSREQLWVGTFGGGVNLYNSNTKSFSRLIIEDNPINDMIIDLALEEDKNLWIITQSSVIIYDIEKETSRLIDGSRGILDKELTNGFFLSPSQVSYVGSINGLTIIPHSFPEQELIPPNLVITEVNVLGEPLDTENIPFWNIQEINLSYLQNYIAFEFRCLDYANPDNNRYKYRLVGLDKDWINAEKRNYANYSNLSPGIYFFEVKGRGSQGNWSNNNLSIKIVINPPFWRTPGAYFLYILLLIGLLYLFFKKLKNQSRQTQRLETKVSQRTAEIEDARQIAEEATIAKGLFLANMSHEIRTPLNGIIGMLTLMEKTEMTPEQKKYMKNTELASESLLNIVSDILDFEKISSGKIQLNIVPFNIREMATYLNETFHNQSADKGIILKTEVHPSVPKQVEGDQKKIIQILSNLITNAIKYTEKGSISLFVNQIPNTNVVSFQVKDTGISIPKERLASIFESFEQLESTYSKTHKGVGLGLAIVKQLVDYLQGTIEVESLKDKGSTFCVKLPLNPITSETSSHNPELKIWEKKDKPLILIAEDETINRLYLIKLLKEWGLNSIPAKNGSLAVKLQKEQNPALILMDINMPELNGIGATKRIRERNKDIPIIALTARVLKEDLAIALNSGMNDYVTKPINENLLNKKIFNYLNPNL